MKAIGFWGSPRCWSNSCWSDGSRGALLAAVLLAAPVIAGCRVNPTSPDMENSAEGKACPPEAKIDDGEDSNNQVLIADGRSGYVYTYVDPEGSSIDPAGGAVFSMTPGGANGSQFALRIAGQLSSATTVYAAMGMNLTDPKGPYDASKYKGISFFAKKGPGSTGKVRIKFPDRNTDPDGGVCGAC